MPAFHRLFLLHFDLSASTEFENSSRHSDFLEKTGILGNDNICIEIYNKGEPRAKKAGTVKICIHY